MVLHNPNNWHWVNKDVSVWARQWFDDNLTKIEAKEGDVSAKISKVVSMDGDVDVAQRKGKVITIFDVKLTLEYSGTYRRRIESTLFLVPVTTCLQTSQDPLRHVKNFGLRNLCSAGSTADNEDVSGTITVPEVSHELEEDEFVVGYAYTSANLSQYAEVGLV